MSRLSFPLLFLAFGIAANIVSAQTFTTLYSFSGADGWAPYTGLVQATNGELYGTTVTDAVGTIFKMTPGGTLTTLVNFCQSGCGVVGAYPAALVQATNGDLYGTTALGGTGAYCSVAGGCGTVFKMTPSGAFTTLYSFCAQSGCADGLYPGSALVQDANGDFYGTTIDGGANGGGAARSSKSLRAAHCPHSTVSAPKARARTARPPTIRSSRPAMGIFTGRHRAAGPALAARPVKAVRAAARSSKSRRAAC
jgi:uncharacterized repeat protein (TIGR03803 family)